MKKFEKITIGYTAKEIFEQFPDAFENVKRLYLQAFRSPEFFEEDTNETLAYMFPNSDLHVNFSLNYCQGDGLNIEGEINLYDFINVWNATEKEKRTMNFYIERGDARGYKFHANRRYGYSCKFIDRKYIDDVVDEFVEDLKTWDIRAIKTDLITRFFNDLIDHFEELDAQYKEAGYNFFYDADDADVFDGCDANDYYFASDGTLI